MIEILILGLVAMIALAVVVVVVLVRLFGRRSAAAPAAAPPAAALSVAGTTMPPPAPGWQVAAQDLLREGLQELSKELDRNQLGPISDLILSIRRGDPVQGYEDVRTLLAALRHPKALIEAFGNFRQHLDNQAAMIAPAAPVTAAIVDANATASK